MQRQAALPGHATAVPEAIVVCVGGEAGGTAGLVETAQHRAADLYQERGEEFLHYGLGLARNEELAKDALQEAFMRYFAALCAGSKIDSPRAWIYRVMHNYLLDRLNEVRFRKEDHLSNAVSGYQDIEGECFRRECLRLIRGALTAREFDCFRLRSEGLKYGEIARMLRVAPGTVGALICRAMRKIRSVLNTAEGEIG